MLLASRAFGSLYANISSVSGSIFLVLPNAGLHRTCIHGLTSSPRHRRHIQVNHILLSSWCDPHINCLTRTVAARHWTLVVASDPLLCPLIESALEPLPGMRTVRHMPAPSANCQKSFQWICLSNPIFPCICFLLDFFDSAS